MGLLWAVGAPGPPFGRGADVWAARDSFVVDALPGAGVLTRFTLLGFPFHWAVVAVGSIAVFIALALVYNLHADARAGVEGDGAAVAPESDP